LIPQIAKEAFMRTGFKLAVIAALGAAMASQGASARVIDDWNVFNSIGHCHSKLNQLRRAADRSGDLYEASRLEDAYCDLMPQSWFAIVFPY
jgi:hypothetical protein